MPSISDPIWGVIGVIATVIFGIFGVIGAILALLPLVQSSKGLSYEFLSTTPILKIARGFQEQIEIRLSGQIVKDVYLVIVRFSNSGRASIRPDDYARPLKLTVTKGQIISADIVNTEPDNLGEIIESRDKTSVTFKKVLLNSKDKFVVKLLVSEFGSDTKDIQIDGRIAGVRVIKESKESLLVEALFASSTPAGVFVLTILLPLFVPVLGALTSSVLKELIASQRKKKDELP